MAAKITGFGHYLPDRRVTNAEIENALSLPGGWIKRRTGIAERRWASPEEAVTDLAVRAGEAALAGAKLRAGEVGLLLLATSTPDHLLPPSAPLVAHRLGLANAGAADLAGACTGFVYALTLADAFTRVHGLPSLVVAGNILSRRMNPADPATSILFADAAGAMVLVPAEGEEKCGLLSAYLGSNGAHYDLIKIDAGGSRRPFTPDVSLAERTMAFSNGPAVYGAAIESMVRTSLQALRKAALPVDDIDWWVPHQANARLIDAAGRELGIPREKTLLSLELCGNSSAATIPLTLSQHWQSQGIEPGKTYLLTAVGAGFTEGAAVYRT